MINGYSPGLLYGNNVFDVISLIICYNYSQHIMNILSESDILEPIRRNISIQTYGAKIEINGVKIVDLRHFSGEDGVFEELLRIDSEGVIENFPGFKVAQISRSQIVPGAIKAWHLHFKQDDLWFVPPEDHAMVGLWDLRSQSPTTDQKMRVTLGAGIARLVYIPRGVAHGIVNLSSKSSSIFYFVNQQFNAEEPDERRLPWDEVGANFWKPEIG